MSRELKHNSSSQMGVSVCFLTLDDVRTVSQLPACKNTLNILILRSVGIRRKVYPLPNASPAVYDYLVTSL